MSAEQAILKDLVQAEIAVETPDPIAQMVHEHSRMVFKIAYSVLRNYADAEDATQEVFVRIVRHARKLSELRDAKAWTARIAWHVAQERVKERAKREKPEANHEDLPQAIEQLQSSDNLEEVAISREQTALLQSLIAGLPEELRETLLLSTVEEMTSADIAKVMRIPEGSVRTRLMRARQLLRQKLSAIWEGGKR